MPPLRTGPAIGLLAQLMLLGLLASTVGLTLLGLTVAIVYGLLTAALLTRALHRPGATTLGRADQVTLLRAVLVGGVTALTLTPHANLPVLVPLASVALALDLVDGAIARHTNTESPLGARFDIEVDAFLLLVLSLYVARTFGLWVVTIAALRYAWVAATPAFPWLGGYLAPRRWRKIVAATQGVVLIAAASTLIPTLLVYAALAAALAALTASFASCFHLLWHTERRPAPQPSEPTHHILQHAA